MPDPGHHEPVGPGSSDVEVFAAGGVVHRAGPLGVEVLLVHRSRYDDWSLPKGKLDPGESLAECALREVAEETGHRCELGSELIDVRYVDHRGRSKLVRYWSMGVVSGGHDSDDEVDEMRWLSPPEARDLLSYDHDRAVIDAFEGTVPDP